MVDKREVRMRVAWVWQISIDSHFSRKLQTTHLPVALVTPLKLRSIIQRVVDVYALVKRLEVDLDLVIVQRIDWNISNSRSLYLFVSVPGQELTLDPLIINQFERTPNPSQSHSALLLPLRPPLFDPRIHLLQRQSTHFRSTLPDFE